MTKRNISAFALAALLAAGATATQAGEFRHAYAQRGGWQEGAAGVNGLPVHIRGLGTFAGGISATRIHGNGIYFAVEPGIGLSARPPASPRVKIINVSQSAQRNACSMEHGVCVIRPGK